MAIDTMLANLPIVKQKVDVLELETKYTMLFGGGRKLMVTAPHDFDETVAGKDEIVFGYFVNKELIATNIGKAKEIIDGFDNLINNENIRKRDCVNMPV